MSTRLLSPSTKQLIATAVDLSPILDAVKNPRSKSKEKSSLFEKFSKFFATPHKKEKEPLAFTVREVCTREECAALIALS